MQQGAFSVQIALIPYKLQLRDYINCNWKNNPIATGRITQLQLDRTNCNQMRTHCRSQIGCNSNRPGCNWTRTSYNSNQPRLQLDVNRLQLGQTQLLLDLNWLQLGLTQLQLDANRLQLDTICVQLQLELSQ